VAEVRFWDTSALLMVFDARERDRRRARGLWSGPRSRKVEHATSVLVAIEAVRKFHRSAPAEVGQLMDALRAMVLVPLVASLLPIAYEIAGRSHATGADTAIVSCAVAIPRVAGKEVEFVTADDEQGDLARAEGLETVVLG